MARIRSIKPEFWADRKLARLVPNRDARMLYMGLWNEADEHGRVQGDARYIKGQVFPYDDDLDEQAIDILLDELVVAKRIERYEAEGDPYLFLPKLAKHQRLEPTKSKSRLPDPPSDSEPIAEDPSPAPIVSDDLAPIVVQQVAGSRLHGAGSKGQVAGPLDAENLAPDPTSRLLAEHIAQHVDKPPLKAQAQTKTAIMSLVAEGVTADRIRAGLHRMIERNVGPGLLPQLVAETDRGKPAPKSTTDDRVAQARAVADRFRAIEAKEITA